MQREPTTDRVFTAFIRRPDEAHGDAVGLVPPTVAQAHGRESGDAEDASRIEEETGMNAVVVDRQEQQSTAVAVNPMQMLAQAVAQGMPIEVLRDLMTLKKEWEADEARKAFVAAMATFKADPPEILKDKRVSYENKTGKLTQYDHATLGNICAAVIQGLAKVAISHRWEVAQNENRIKVTCILTHAQGHSESVSMHSAADDSGGKNSIQAIASAVTYLQRYTLMSATGLAAMDKEADDDGAGAEPGYFINEKQIYDLKALGEEVGVNKDQFLKFMKVDGLEKIPASQYKTAVAGLESKRK
jgi:hypothetical protein